MNQKKWLVIELVLVVSISFLPSIVYSIYSLVVGTNIYSASQYTADTFLIQILRNLLSIALMFYVLYRQGNTFKSIGIRLTITGTDLLHAMGIAFAINIINWVLFVPLASAFPDFAKQASNPRNLEFIHSGAIFFLLLMTVLNPFYEELIVRGFTMTEMFDITGSKYLAVIVSVAIQFSYHLYQGLPSALLLLPYFVIPALYFVRFGNLNPIILTHLLVDLISLVRHRR